MEVFKTFRFSAAHRLDTAPPGHKCRSLHGHTYRLDVHVAGEPDEQVGWIIDFGDIKQAVAPVLDQLDHAFLNDVEGLETTTVEHLAPWIWTRLKPALPGLSKIVVWENETSGCVYTGA